MEDGSWKFDTIVYFLQLDFLSIFFNLYGRTVFVPIQNDSIISVFIAIYINIGRYIDINFAPFYCFFSKKMNT